MNNKSRNQLLSLLLRFSGIGFKFILVFMITKYEGLNFQGKFTLINQTIALMIYFVGLDYYNYYTRKMVLRPERTLFYFKNAMVIYLISGIFVGLFFVGFNFLFSNLSTTIVLLMLLVFIVEHLSQELIRVYIALGKVLFANFLLFLKTGFWSLIVCFLFFFQQSIEMGNLLLVWAFGSLMACILGLYYFPKIEKILNEKIDLSVIQKGLQFSFLIFLSTICIRLVEFSDKYLLDLLMTRKEVGIYSVYFQISNVYSVVISTAIFSFIYPQILRDIQKGNHKLLELSKNKYYKSCYYFSVILIGLYLIFFYPLFALIGKTELINEFYICVLLIISSMFVNLSNFHQAMLIGKGKGIIILKICLLVLLINLIGNLLLIPILGLLGSAIVQILSAASFFILRKSFTSKLLLINE